MMKKFINFFVNQLYKMENSEKDFYEKYYKNMMEKRKAYYEANKERLKLYYQSRKGLISERHENLNIEEKHELRRYNREYYKKNNRYIPKMKVIRSDPIANNRYIPKMKVIRSDPIANISTGKFVVEL